MMGILLKASDKNALSHSYRMRIHEGHPVRMLDMRQWGGAGGGDE